MNGLVEGSTILALKRAFTKARITLHEEILVLRGCGGVVVMF